MVSVMEKIKIKDRWRMMKGGYFSRVPRQASLVKGLFSRGLKKLKALLPVATGGASVVPLQGPRFLSSPSFNKSYGHLLLPDITGRRSSKESLLQGTKLWRETNTSSLAFRSCSYSWIPRQHLVWQLGTQ